MNLNDLLLGKGIDPRHILVLRHRPNESELNKVLPWLAAGEPDVFNAYQQMQGERVERAMQAMTGAGYVASFHWARTGESSVRWLIFNRGIEASEPRGILAGAGLRQT